MTTQVLGNRTFAKISELDPAVDFDNSDEFVFVQNGSTLKINGQQIANSVTTINNLASLGYVDTKVASIVDSAPLLLNTLAELSAALNNDENFASTITALIGTKLSASDFSATFNSSLASNTTDDLVEGGVNLYFTEERVLSVITAQPKPDRLTNGTLEVVLQSNGYITLANGAQLYDYFTVEGSGYGITDSLGSTYIGYDPGDTLGALHMDVYNGKNIRIRTTPAGTSNYKDWLFAADGKLTLPAGPTSANHAATKGYVDSQVDAVVAGQGFATVGYVNSAISSAAIDGGEF